MSAVSSTGWFQLILFLFFTLALGAVLRERVKTSLDFQLAGRTLPTWLAAISFALSGLSLLEFLAMGAAGAQYGLAATGFFAAGSLVAMLFTGLVIAPRLRASGLRTVAAYIGQRLGAPTQRLHASLFLAAALVAASLALAVFARMVVTLHLLDLYFIANLWAPKNIFPATVVFAVVVATLYVLLAGMVATMGNHLLQGLVLLAGILPALVLGLRHGHLDQLHETLARTGAATPYNGALLLIAGILFGIVFWCADPRALQIALSTKNSREAGHVALWAAPLRIVLTLLFVGSGIVALVQPTPQLLSSVKVVNGTIYRNTIVVPHDAALGQGLVPAQLDASGKPSLDDRGNTLLDGGRATPMLLLHRLPVKLQGLALGALLAALLSGLAAAFSAIGTTFTQDLSPHPADEDAVTAEIKKLAANRWAIGGAALACLGLACLWSFAPAVGTPHVFALVLLLSAVFGAPALVTVLLAVFAPRVAGTGSFAGLAAAQLAALVTYGITLPAQATRGLLGGFFCAGVRTASALEQSLLIAAVALLAHLAVSFALASRNAATATATQEQKTLPPAAEEKH